MQKIGIQDGLMKTIFGIDLIGITEHDGKLILSFFGKGHRDIEIKLNPLERVGSGCILSQKVFDAKVDEFEKLIEDEE